jgi:hypothetical protein
MIAALREDRRVDSVLTGVIRACFVLTALSVAFVTIDIRTTPNRRPEMVGALPEHSDHTAPAVAATTIVGSFLIMAAGTAIGIAFS